LWHPTQKTALDSNQGAVFLRFNLRFTLCDISVNTNYSREWVLEIFEPETDWKSANDEWVWAWVGTVSSWQIQDDDHHSEPL